MKKILLSLVLLLLLISCGSRSPEDYHIISDSTVDGYYIYEYEHKGIFCNTYYEDIYYSGAVYNYGFSFYSCSADMTFFINKDGEFIYLQVAMEQGLISLESLMPELDELQRHPEEISSDEADYYWLDYHIDHKVVYAYAGGECDLNSSETFIIDGKTYYYNASGCLQDHILFLRVNQEYVTIAKLLMEGEIDGKYIIPLLTEQP
ncbi:MAG: hypothetical protein KAU02_03415 [Tenericutes bacterium]|nr:hypothetical protein [Mycoplasmatota bacterium]